MRTRAILSRLPARTRTISDTGGGCNRTRLMDITDSDNTGFFRRTQLGQRGTRSRTVSSVGGAVGSSSLSTRRGGRCATRVATGLRSLGTRGRVRALVGTGNFTSYLYFLRSNQTSLAIVASNRPLATTRITRVHSIILDGDDIATRGVAIIRIGWSAILPFYPDVTTRNEIFPGGC